MNKMRTIKLIVFLGIAWLMNYLPIVSFAQEKSQKIIKCKVESSRKVKYKLVSIDRTEVKPPFITGLRIVLKKNRFNRNYMIKLAQRLNAEYCNEEVISAAIFDDYKAAKRADAVIEYLLKKRSVPELRGFYSLNRNTGEELIEFSAKRGNPPNEIKINLNQLRLEQKLSLLKCGNSL